MSINVTDGRGTTPTNPAAPNVPGKPGLPKKPNPQEIAKQRQRENLQRKQEQITKQLEKLKTSIAKPIRDLALILSVGPENDPNDDPQYLFRQIRPLLSKMGIANFADGSKTEIVPGKTRKEDSLYKVRLRRTAQITEDVIERIKRQSKNFESMQWSSEALEVYLWYPYEAPPETVTTAPAPGEAAP